MARLLRPQLAPLLGLVVVLVAALHWWEPFLTQQRVVITSTPSPGPRGVPIGIPLRPGSQLCVAPVELDAHTQRAQVWLWAAQPGPTALQVTPGGTTVRPVLTNAPTAVQLPLPATGTQVCVRNASASRIRFTATNDPIAIGLAHTAVDGQALQGQAVELELVEAGRQSILGRLGTIVHHAADFTGDLMPFWLAWPLVVALVIGTPLAILFGFWTTLRADGD
jgi:hypothetical protein